jgi:hypothetical protein
MRRYLPMTFALLFLFVFVFGMSANFHSAVSSVPNAKCFGCCVIPATPDCSQESGQIYRGKCSCLNYVYCMPSPCDFWCKVCK